MISKIIFVAYCFLIIFLSSLTPEDLPNNSWSVHDHVLHIIEYAVLGILAWGAFGRGGDGFPWALFAFCCCFGIADECWQDWLGRFRTADVWDVAMDAAGSFVGLLCSMVFWKK